MIYSITKLIVFYFLQEKDHLHVIFLAVKDDLQTAVIVRSIVMFTRQTSHTTVVCLDVTSHTHIQVHCANT